MSEFTNEEIAMAVISYRNLHKCSTEEAIIAIRKLLAEEAKKEIYHG